MTALAGWQNPRWSEITDPIFRHIFQSLEEWSRNPTVSTISTPHSTVQPTYNAVTDRVDQPAPVTLFGDQLIAGKIQSSNYVAGSAGWVINSDGSAEFSNVTVRGDLKAGTVASGPMAGLARFEVVNSSGDVFFRQGNLFVDDSSASGIAFRHVTAGPTYTTKATLGAGSGGVTLVSAAGNECGLLSGNASNGVRVNDSNVELLAGGHARITRGAEGGAVVGYRGLLSGRCWIQSAQATVSVPAVGAGNSATITFPTAFPASPIVTVCNGFTGTTLDGIGVASVTSTGFAVARLNGSVNGPADMQINYVVVYAA